MSLRYNDLEFLQYSDRFYHTITFMSDHLDVLDIFDFASHLQLPEHMHAMSDDITFGRHALMHVIYDINAAWSKAICLFPASIGTSPTDLTAGP